MVFLRFLFVVVIVNLFAACGDDPQTVYVVPVSPQLPKIDCRKYVTKITEEVAQAGLGNSSVGQGRIVEAYADCEAENKRRGY